MPEQGVQDFVGYTAPLWDVPWNYWEKFAHRYGSGSVTVSVKDKRSLMAAAVAVRRWNEAAGVAIFKLAKPGKDKAEADVVIKTHQAEAGESFTSGDGTPGVTYPLSGSSRGFINIFRPDEADDLFREVAGTKWEQYVVAHELGHTIGFDHSTKSMGGGGIMGSPGFPISEAEGARARDLVEPQVREGQMKPGLQRRSGGSKEERYENPTQSKQQI